MINLTNLKKIIKRNSDGKQLQIVALNNIYYNYKGIVILNLKSKDSVNVLKFMQEMKYNRICKDDISKVEEFYNSSDLVNVFNNFTNKDLYPAKNTNITFEIDDIVNGARKINVIKTHKGLKLFDAEYIELFNNKKVSYHTTDDDNVLVIKDEYNDSIAIVMPYSRYSTDEIKDMILDQLN